MLESLLFQFKGFLNLFTPGPYKDMAGMCLQLSLFLIGPTYDSLGHDINYLALSGILAVSVV